MAIRRGTERARPIPGTGMRAYDPEGIDCMTDNLIVCVCVQVTLVLNAFESEFAIIIENTLSAAK